MTEEVKRSKRETGEADSDSYEEYKSDEDHLQEVRGGIEEATAKNVVDKVEIISQHKDEKVVDGITEKDDTVKKETGDKKKEKKKREKHSKHARDEEGGEVIGGQEKKEKKREKRSKEGKKEKKSKELKKEEKIAQVQTEIAEQENIIAVKIEDIRQKEFPETVEKPKENVEEVTKPSEALLAKLPKVENEAASLRATAPPAVLESLTDAETTAATQAAQDTASSRHVTDSTVVDEVAAHPVATTSEASVAEPVEEEAPTSAAGEKDAHLVVQTEVAPPSEAPVPGKAKETGTSHVIPHMVLADAALSAAAAAEPTLSETAPPPAEELSREPVKEHLAAEETRITVTEPSVAKSHSPEPTLPSSDAAVTTSGDLPPPQSDASDEAKASAKAGPQLPIGVEQILEHARKEAQAAGSSRMLMARSLVARQEKLQKQLTNIRHEFGDIDSEIRALKIDCYRNQRAFTKHL